MDSHTPSCIIPPFFPQGLPASFAASNFKRVYETLRPVEVHYKLFEVVHHLVTNYCLLHGQDTAKGDAFFNAISRESMAQPDELLEEVDAAYGLFYATWKDIADGPLAQKGLEWPCTIDGATFEQLPEGVRRDATGTVRAWMAVVTYYLADEQVLHE